jgi:DNA polymerase
MTLMSREDMLRELELLPVWQLRQPLPVPFKVETLATDKIEQVVTEPVVQEQDIPAAEMPVIEIAVVESLEAESLVPESLAPESLLPQQTEVLGNVGIVPAQEPVLEQTPPLPLRILSGEDSNYAFLIESYAAEDNVQQIETLLQNMIRAMQVSCRMDVTDTADKIFAVHTPKLIISLGAAPANRLAGKLHGIEEWRNIQQQNQPYYEQIPFIVTYHPAHLLVNTADKALAWRDLCLAMKLMQRL